MRTTLDIDADVLSAAKEIARRSRKTAGQVVSELLRQALAAASSPEVEGVSETRASYGIEPFPPRGGVVTNEIIDAIADESGE